MRRELGLTSSRRFRDQTRKDGMKQNSSEFFLMTIFPQTFFAFVRGNFMPFAFFTTRQELFTSFAVDFLSVQFYFLFVGLNAVFKLIAERLLIATFELCNHKLGVGNKKLTFDMGLKIRNIHVIISLNTSYA